VVPEADVGGSSCDGVWRDRGREAAGVRLWWCGILAQELPPPEGNRLREEAP